MKLFALLLAGLWGASAGTLDVAPKGKTAGSPNAPITIEIYSDFQCPACKALYEQTLRPLMRDYVVPGKVFLIHREFPLPGHAFSKVAASYASAAARLGSGKYDEVASILFLRQASWAATGNVDQTVASVLGPVEMNKVRAISKEPAIAAEIQEDVNRGNAAGIRQTPTMFVTHRMRKYPFSGSVNYDLLRTLLNELLTK